MKSNLITTGCMKLERLVVCYCRYIFVLLTLGICVFAHDAENMHPPVIESGKGLDVLVVGRKRLVYDRMEWDDEAIPQGVRIYNQVCVLKLTFEIV
jgi:hypothetical protein